MLLDGLLVQGDEDIDPVSLHGDLLPGGPNYCKIMSSPDERGIVVVHENAIAQTAKEARYGKTCFIYAVTGNSPDKCRKIVHLHSSGMEINIFLWIMNL